MIHFAYPNVAQGQFLGCGRYGAWPAEQTPPPGYHVATITEVTNPQAVYAAAQVLAPALRTMEVTALVYERRDRAEHDYRGDSLDLAYLLATILCAWPLRLGNESFPGDIWCTGRITYLAAAMPSASGKTNLAMVVSQLPGWRAWTVGDDIAWMHVDSTGQLRAMNPERGFFGVAPNTSPKTNPNATAMVRSNTIFTNVALTPSGEPWWEGLTPEPPAGLHD